MEDRAHLDRDYNAARRDGTLDSRDPVAIAGDDGKYVDMEIANSKDADVSSRQHRSSSGGMAGLKKRIGSLRHKGKGSEE